VAFLGLLYYAAYIYVTKIQKSLAEQRPEVLQDTFANFIQASILGLYLIHPGIIYENLMFFRCRKLGDDFYLEIDTQISCTSNKYVAWSVFAGLYFAVYGVGLIFCAVLAMRKYYYKVKIYEREKKQNRQGKPEDPAPKKSEGRFVMEMQAIAVALEENYLEKAAKESEFITRVFSFMLQGYKIEAYYFEAVVMLRKVFIIALSVFFPPILQLQFGILIIIFAVEMHRIIDPYQSALLYRLEFIGLQVTLFTLIIAVLFYLQNTSDVERETLSVALLLSNAMVICMFVFAARNSSKCAKYLAKLWGLAPAGYSSDDERMKEYSEKDDEVTIQKIRMRSKRMSAKSGRSSGDNWTAGSPV